MELGLRPYHLEVKMQTRLLYLTKLVKGKYNFLQALR
jgi:hypothetical protein